MVASLGSPAGVSVAVEEFQLNPAPAESAGLLQKQQLQLFKLLHQSLRL